MQKFKKKGKHAKKLINREKKQKSRVTIEKETIAVVAYPLQQRTVLIRAFLFLIQEIDEALVAVEVTIVAVTIAVIVAVTIAAVTYINIISILILIILIILA